MFDAGLAQSVEQLICNQQVEGSSPLASSRVSLDAICVQAFFIGCKGKGMVAFLYRFAKNVIIKYKLT